MIERWGDKKCVGWSRDGVMMGDGGEWGLFGGWR